MILVGGGGQPDRRKEARTQYIPFSLPGVGRGTGGLDRGGRGRKVEADRRG